MCEHAQQEVLVPGLSRPFCQEEEFQDFRVANDVTKPSLQSIAKMEKEDNQPRGRQRNNFTFIDEKETITD